MTQTPQETLKTNHNIRVVTLVTGEKVLCLFGEVRQEGEVVGYRLIYPFVLTLGAVNEDGSMPINYTRWCPFSPVEEHKVGGTHIMSVVFPDNQILDNFVGKLKENGFTDEQLFFEEGTDGSESSATGE
jgi:hypothetical protein|tara:strand:- start:234 stop:620 length:387 start_codon:yes stop_codon:yes gene_type:complete